MKADGRDAPESVLPRPSGESIFAGRERVPTGIRSLPFLTTDSGTGVGDEGP